MEDSRSLRIANLVTRFSNSWSPPWFTDWWRIKQAVRNKSELSHRQVSITVIGRENKLQPLRQHILEESTHPWKRGVFHHKKSVLRCRAVRQTFYSTLKSVFPDSSSRQWNQFIQRRINQFVSKHKITGYTEWVVRSDYWSDARSFCSRWAAAVPFEQTPSHLTW